MIKNIVFDMGNVLTVYNAREYIYGYVDNEEDFRWIKNHLCASVEWLRMDRGTMTDEEAVRSVCRRVPAHLHDTVERFVREYRMVYERDLDILRAWAAQTGTGGLSGFLQDIFTQTRRMLFHR